MKILYVVNVGNGKCITHDGYIQLGIHNHSAERHISLCDELADRNGFERIHWVEAHWAPDIFAIRYKRVSFQQHERANEGSPKTDNAGCKSLQPEERLGRAV